MPIKPLKNESELLKLVANADERAFKILFEGYYQSLGEYVYRTTGSASIAEEIVQDTFIKIWLKRENLIQIKSFSDYIFILCRNQTYNALRKLAVERNLIQEFDDLSELNNISEVYSESIEPYRQLINAAVEKLPAQAQKVYLLSRDERLKHEEIAHLLKISTETVKKHIQYANKFIKDDVRSRSSLVIISILLTPLVI